MAQMLSLSSHAWTGALATFTGIWCVFLAAAGPVMAYDAARARPKPAVHHARTYTRPVKPSLRR